MPIFKKNNNQQQQQSPYAKEKLGSGGTTPFKRPGSKRKLHIVQNTVGFFKIMFHIKPGNHSKAYQNADPQELQEIRAVQEYKNGLHFPANMLTNHEATEYYRMGTPYPEVKNIAWMRLLGSLMMMLIPILAYMIWHKSWILVGLVLAPFLFWVFIGVAIKSSYKGFTIHQQFMFDILMSILSPYLYQMNQANANSKNGGSVSMNAILGHVVHRLNDQRTKHSVATLGIDIRHHPHEFGPYAKFARTFSTSPMAYMFMSSVYHMANGSTDDSAIRYLNESAMHDLLKQINKIKIQKLKRFFTPPVVMFIDWFLLVLTYFTLYTFNMLKTDMPNT